MTESSDFLGKLPTVPDKKTESRGECEKKPAEKAVYAKKVQSRSSGFWLFLFFVYLFYSIVGTIAFFIDHFDKRDAWQIVVTYFSAFFFLKRYLRPCVNTVFCSKDEEGAYFLYYVDDTPVEPSQPVEKPDFFDKLMLYEGYLLFGIFFLFIIYISIVNVKRVIESLAMLPTFGLLLYICFIIVLAGAQSGGISDSLGAQAELRDLNNRD